MPSGARWASSEGPARSLLGFLERGSQAGLRHRRGAEAEEGSEGEGSWEGRAGDQARVILCLPHTVHTITPRNQNLLNVNLQ